VHANYLRIDKWSIFKEQGLYVGEDLTVSEQDTVNRIRTIMHAYWNVPFFPSSKFSRDKLKCTIDGNSRMVLLSLNDVETFAKSKRID
jgi:hypothetical protein